MSMACAVLDMPTSSHRLFIVTRPIRFLSSGVASNFSEGVKSVSRGWPGVAMLPKKRCAPSGPLNCM